MRLMLQFPLLGSCASSSAIRNFAYLPPDSIVEQTEERQEALEPEPDGQPTEPHLATGVEPASEAHLPDGVETAPVEPPTHNGVEALDAPRAERKAETTPARPARPAEASSAKTPSTRPRRVIAS